MARGGASTRRTPSPGSQTCTAVFTAARIARSPRAGRIYRRRMGGSGRWQIAALEDKIVQGATVMVLNAIYEEDFLGFSYGFRPGR